MYDTTEEKIRDLHSHKSTVEGEVMAAKWLIANDYTVLHNRKARTNQIGEGVANTFGEDIQYRRCLDSLTEINIVVEHQPPGTGQYIRHHRTEKNFFPPEFEDRAVFDSLCNEEISRLVAEVQQSAGEDDGDTVASIVSDYLNCRVEEVEAKLREPADSVERAQRYDKVFRALDRSGAEITGDYDGFGWRNVSIRWNLSREATERDRNHSVDDF